MSVESIIMMVITLGGYTLCFAMLLNNVFNAKDNRNEET